MYKIIEIDGKVHQHIAKNNKPDKYAEPKLFKTYEDAEKWIWRHRNKYIPVSYVISEVIL